MVTKRSHPVFYVVLVEPKNSGNIGAVARAMMNFSVEHLLLVNPCELDQTAYTRAMHATKILDNAQIFSSFHNAVQNLDYLVATSSIASKTEKRHLRNPVFLEEFAEKIGDVNGKVGLVFGREDYGLFNEEIATCDIMVKIPTSEEYPSLNLSHAVIIVLYALYKNQDNHPKQHRRIGSVEKEKLYEFFSELLDDINYPDHKKEHTEIMVRRILGRAMLSQWEYHTLMGVLSKQKGRSND